MNAARITATELFEKQHDRLGLRWLAGQKDGARRVLEAVETVARRPSLAGYLNTIYPNRVQILGTEELSWLDGLDARQRWETIQKIMDYRPLALVISKSQTCPEDLREAAEESDTPLWASPRRGHELLNHLQYVMARTLAVNNVGMAATFQPFVAAMRQRGSGTLVGIASVAAIRGLPGHGAYCASKAGVVAYCESLRGELRGSGVRVVTLLPGYVDTPLTRKNRYPMPFLLSADRFAQRALRAIEQGVSYRVIPWQMALVAKLLRVLPNAWFDRLLSGRPRKARADQGSATGS